MSTAPGLNYGPLEANLRSKWGWFVALGVVLVILGVIALTNVLVATVASVFIIGILMLIAGIGQIIHAFEVRTWGSFFIWALAGILYAVAGFLAFFNPMLAAMALTLLLAIALFFSGVFRIATGIQLRPALGWGWILGSGIVSVLAGIAIGLAWPFSSLFILGLILALDLIFQGAAAIAFGLALKPRHAHA